MVRPGVSSETRTHELGTSTSCLASKLPLPETDKLGTGTSGGSKLVASDSNEDKAELAAEEAKVVAAAPDPVAMAVPCVSVADATTELRELSMDEPEPGRVV